MDVNASGLSLSGLRDRHRNWQIVEKGGSECVRRHLIVRNKPDTCSHTSVFGAHGFVSQTLGGSGTKIAASIFPGSCPGGDSRVDCCGLPTA